MRAQLCREETIGLKVFRKNLEDYNFRNFNENSEKIPASEKYPFYSNTKKMNMAKIVVACYSVFLKNVFFKMFKYS